MALPTNYKSLADDKNQGFKTRWMAIQSLADSNYTLNKDTLSTWTKSKEWFVRNAALVAISRHDPDRAQGLAIGMLKDQALVVRSAAVELLSSSPKNEVREYFWKAMSDPVNFRKGTSLWIRSQVMDILSQNPLEGEKQRFKSFIEDKDHLVASMASVALSKIP
jgi:HEAT repeat protein